MSKSWTLVHYFLILQVPKQAVKTRAFQDDCVTGVIEQLTEHLAQNSYSVAFPELSVVPLVQIRRTLKEVKVDRFRKLIKQLVEQVSFSVRAEYLSLKIRVPETLFHAIILTMKPIMR